MRLVLLALVAAVQCAMLVTIAIVPPAALADLCIPSALPGTGAGGGSGCARDLGGCGDQGQQAAASMDGVAYVGSAPGRPGHGTLLMLARPGRLAQTGNCGGQNSPPQPNSTPSPPVMAPGPGGDNGSGGGSNIPDGGSADNTRPGAGALGGAGGGSSAPTPTPIPCPAPPLAPTLPDPKDVALQIPFRYPAIQIGINPAPLGLTGLPSWFWIGNYDGQAAMAGQAVDLPGQPNSRVGCPGGPGAHELVTVQLIPTGYDWSFGDEGDQDLDGTWVKSRLTTRSLGQAYPAQSDIRHTYVNRSDVDGHPEGFPVSVVAHFAVAYQKDGGAWQEMPPVQHTYTAAYRVQELRTELTRPTR